MTQPRNPVDEVLDAYFDYVEGIGEEPTLDHLTDDERTEAEQLISSLKAGRGIDPHASRPSVAALIATAHASREAASERAIEQALQAGLEAGVDSGAIVARDVASIAAGFASRLVVHVRGMRIRVLVEPAGAQIDGIYGERVPAIAAVFGAFPDTSAVLLTTSDNALAGAIVDRDDVVTAIETPSGLSRPPRIRRPITDSVAACGQYAAECLPAFEPFEYVASGNGNGSGLLGMLDVDQIAAAAVDDVVASGQRARLAAKRQAWSELVEREKHVIAAILRDALAGSISEDEYRRRVEASVVEAA